MSVSEIRLSAEHENALRESEETGYWYPQNAADQRVAVHLKRCGLIELSLLRRDRWEDRGYWITAAGRDWLALHPTEVAR